MGSLLRIHARRRIESRSAAHRLRGLEWPRLRLPPRRGRGSSRLSRRRLTRGRLPRRRGRRALRRPSRSRASRSRASRRRDPLRRVGSGRGDGLRRRRRRWCRLRGRLRRSRCRCRRGRHCGRGGVAGRQERERIDVRLGVADSDPEVDIGDVVLRRAGEARLCDRGPFADSCPSLDEQRSQMREGGLVSIRSRDGHGQAVGRHLPGERDLA